MTGPTDGGGAPPRAPTQAEITEKNRQDLLRELNTRLVKHQEALDAIEDAINVLETEPELQVKFDIISNAFSKG